MVSNIIKIKKSQEFCLDSPPLSQQAKRQGLDKQNTWILRRKRYDCTKTILLKLWKVFRDFPLKVSFFQHYESVFIL